MDFFLDPHTPLPASEQIQEQVKLALLLGRLRPGDTLPSIRDVEKQINLSRNIVRKAYLALQRSGILDLRHGKGVLVQKHLSYSGRGTTVEHCEEITEGVLAKAHQLGISPSALARYIYQRAREHEGRAPALHFADITIPLAQERAAKISSFWQVNVGAVSLEELAAMSRSRVTQLRKLLTTYLRLDEVRKIVGRTSVDVIPVSLSFTEAMQREFGRFPAKANVVLVLDDRDYPSLSLILDTYRKVLVDPSVKLSALSQSKVEDLGVLLKSGTYDKVILSNRIWDSIPKKLQSHSRVTRPKMDIDLASLESIRIQAGVVM